MSKNYRQLNKEVHSASLILQDAYNKGYEQAKADYDKPEIEFEPVPHDGGLQFRCNGCNRVTITKYPYCPWCGCPKKEP